MPAHFKPHLLSVELARHLLSWKVWAVSKLLRLLGHHKAVRKLQAGVEAFSVQNNPKNDTQLVFSSRALLALEAALDPSEAGDYLTMTSCVVMPGCLCVCVVSLVHSVGQHNSKLSFACYCGRV